MPKTRWSTMPLCVLLAAGCDPTAVVSGSVEQLAEECIVDVDGSTLHCPDRQGGLVTDPLRYAGDKALPTVLDALTASDPKVQIVAAMQLHNAYAAPDALDPAKVHPEDAAALLTRVGALPPNVQRRAVAFTIAASMPHDGTATRAFLATVEDPEGRVRGWSAILQHSAPATALADVAKVRALAAESIVPEAAQIATLGAGRMRQSSAALDAELCAWGRASLESAAHSMASALVEKRCPKGKALVMKATLAAAAEGRLKPGAHLPAVRGLCDAPFAEIMGESLPTQCPALHTVLVATAQNAELAVELRGEALHHLAVDWPNETTETLLSSLHQTLPEEVTTARKLLAIHLPKPSP